MSAEDEQLAETRELKKVLEGVDKRLAANLHLSKQTRRLTHWAIALAVVTALCVVGMGAIVYQNRQNAVTQCENSNDARAAFRFVWDFVLGAELADPDNNPRENVMSNLILPYIHEKWKEQDCSDLSKNYPEPKRPILPENYGSAN